MSRGSTGGAIVDFRGGWNGKAMVLEGLWPVFSVRAKTVWCA
jgi:hypothetical protein